MSTPTMVQGWREFRPTKGQAFALAAGAAFLLLVIGFGPAGWVTGARAQEMVREAATQARIDLAVAICVDEFMHAADAKKQLSGLKSASWYDRAGLLANSGWATM